MCNNQVHQNVLGSEIYISDVLDRETHTLYSFPVLCDEAAVLRDVIKWTLTRNIRLLHR